MERENFSQDAVFGSTDDVIMDYLNHETLSKENIHFRDIVFSHIQHQMEFRFPMLSPFGEDCEWMNTTRSLSSVEDLGKKIYIIDFFTYCCINCLHILPYLAEVENKYANKSEFAVIGIHSPKFPNEKDAHHVKQAIIRHKIKHPVINDPDCTLWKKFDIFCWPTVFIVGPDNIVLFVLIGEIQIAKTSLLCDYIFEYFETHSLQLDLCPLPISELKEPELDEKGLSFPGNISTNGSVIIVSDTGHNRLLLMSRCLEVKETIGSSDIGSNDGPFDTASFNSPHGTAWYKDDVFVADTGNHSIRKINFKEKVVSTIFSDRVAADSKNPHCTKFHSPWDVCVGPRAGSVLTVLNTLYVAVAGSHQIWDLDIENEFKSSSREICMPFAGTGKEENRQNSYKDKAGFAQPSGITYSHLIPERIFVADSESSTIKSISLNFEKSFCLPERQREKFCVKTIVGGGLDPTDLFKFGDLDGKYLQAKLQHPMGVCVFNKNSLLIADTYNHKIKLVNVQEARCYTVQTIVGLNEPSDLCILDNTLFIADTNNHRIVTFPVNEMDLPTSLPTALEDIPTVFDFVMCSHNVSREDTPETMITISNDGRIYCYFKVVSSERYDLNEKGSQIFSISFEGVNLHSEHRVGNIFGEPQPALILKPKPFLSTYESSDLYQLSQVKLTVSIPVCDKELKVCCYKEVLFNFFVKCMETGPRAICLNLELIDEHKLSGK